MKKWNIALGFYQNPQTAHKVLKKLKDVGLKRSALIQRSHFGQLEVLAYHPSFITLMCLISWLIFIIFLDLLIPSFRFFLLPILILSVFGITSWIIISWCRYRIDKSILNQFQQWVIHDEILVISEIPLNSPKALTILRYVESGHPYSFLLRPPLGEYEWDSEELVKEPLTIEQMNDRAKELAKSLEQVGFNVRKKKYLLKSLAKTEKVLAAIRLNVAEAEHVEQTITTSAEWLLDNIHMIQGNIEEVQRNLPQKFYDELPKILSGSLEGFPRIYALAKDLITCTANKLSRENIISYLESYQSVSLLTIGELWAFQLMLKFRLIECIKSLAENFDRRMSEGEYASFWGNRLLNVAKREPEKLQHFLNELVKQLPSPSPHFGEELLDHLFDEEKIIPLVVKWMEEQFGKPISEVIHQEQMQKTSEQIAFSNAVVSLITLSQLSWREIFESVSPIDKILKRDPEDIYAKMNFATRDLYRRSIEVLSRKSNYSESQIALVSLQLASQNQISYQRHVGYFLIDKGREFLEQTIGYRYGFFQQLRRLLLLYPSFFYLGGILSATVLLELAVFHLQLSWHASWHQIIAFCLLALLPLSEFSVQTINFILTQILHPFMLAKMSFETGIPKEFKTFVVIPVLFSNEEQIKEHFNRLEIHFLANDDSSLKFGLLFDFIDASMQHIEKDQELLDFALKRFESLEEKHGTGKFFLLSRDRKWSHSENQWIGWERKRGKLESLNRFLIEGSSDIFLKAGIKEELQGIRYVITLDADTQLPRGSAREMIETIAHPLNKSHISKEKTIERGYAIIQPRVSTNFAQAKFSLFSRIFSDIANVDPYTQAVSDVYQDLMHEGTYHGKGIYDLHIFHQILSDRFPDEHLLSHDLIEGCYVRVGFADDICLFDYYPQDYMTWSIRQHRWMRGDWQIIDWLFPSVIDKAKKKSPNPVSWINRWKIFDNLRRALMPIAFMALLTTGWLFSSFSLFWTLLVAIIFVSPQILQFFSVILANPSTVKNACSEFLNGLLKIFITFILLPHQALVSLDALGRVLYRRFVSHKLLLQWQTGYSRDEVAHRRFIFKMGWISAFSLGLVVAIFLINPSEAKVAVPFCLLWIISPFIVWILDQSYLKDPVEELSLEDKIYLRKVARKTWRYFDDFVGTQSHWLPPDNYQAALMIEIAQRTSPTNIGLWLLSALAAYDLKYITADDLIHRIQGTFETIRKLELYEGHLLNWYDIQTLKPLYPRYVSTVDSGNLLASLWTLEQGVHQLLEDPILQFGVLNGLKDTFEIFEKSDKNLTKLTAFKQKLHKIPDDLPELIAVNRSFLELLQDIFIKENIVDNEQIYLLKKLESQLLKNLDTIDRYCSWIEILHAIPSQELLKLDPEAIVWRTQIVKNSLSLKELASNELPSPLIDLMVSFEKKQGSSPILDESFHQLREAIQRSQWLAGEKWAEAQALITELREICDRMNMRFLYNQDRKLFSIGYRVDDCRLDSSHYDLLASESRIASLVAIAKGDVPVDHWWSLGRSYRIVDGHQVLISWGGTMFEYLMPLLFNPYYPDSLLGKACKEAVACQMIYGKKRGIPWGISEAAYSEIDFRRTYQYRSFGVPGLGFKRSLEEDLVVSPYSSALALTVNPVEAIHNLKELTQGSHDLLNSYGYYESIDFTRQKGPLGERGVIVYAYMAHHEGMSLLAFDNALNNRIMVQRFHANAQVLGVESLLYEKTPLHPAVAKGSRAHIPISRLTAFSTVPIMGVVNTPHTEAPKVNLLSNGEYALMVTNSGGGYSRWKNIDITRWRSDTTCDNWGSFCYIKDKSSKVVWSTAFHPTHTKGKKYSVSFKADKVEMSRRDEEIETSTEIVVSPEDQAEIRLVTLANLSKIKRDLELTSYLELALALHETDRSHPCFNKLFIETEALTDLSGLLGFRRLRSSDEHPIWVVHVAAVKELDDSEFKFETDRAKFIGRGRSLQNPIAMEKKLSNSHGAVLDPIFSIRKEISILPGERIKIAFITAIADSREKAIALMKKYGDLSSSERAIEMAWSHAQMELRHLRIQQEEAQLFQKLASRILYPHAQLRPSADRLRRNRYGQSHLWAYGISGDLPIIVVNVADIHEIDLVKQVLIAHSFWRMRGLKTDLIIINEESTGYEHPLFDQVQRIIQSHAHHTDIAKPGGVYLINADQLPEEDLILILSVARVNLVAARGSLRQQLVSPTETIKRSERLLVNNRIKDFPSKPLPFLELAYFNKLGGFTSDGREYVIYLDADQTTPAPWINVIANSQFGALVSESGLGCTWYGNSQTNRITSWSNDPLLNTISDTIYIRDNDLGISWTPCPSPIRERDPYRIRHGQGYTVFEHNSHGLEQELLVFIPVDEEGGKPVRIQKLRLYNSSPQSRSLSLFAYSEIVLGSHKEETEMHIITDWDPESQALFAYNHYHPDFSNSLAFACASPMPTSFTGNRTEFLGRNNQTSNPESLKRKTLSGSTGVAIDPCFALQVSVQIEPGEMKEVIFILGYALDTQTARQLILNCREKKWIDSALEKTADWWDRLLGTIKVETPIPCIDYSMNRWLLYQNLSCRIWGRTAFYQSSGAYGFRDQLQDVMALIYSAPQIARKHILKAAGRQFIEGDVQHWWHEASGGGVRTRITDDLLWLPYVTAHYVKVTEDFSILEENVYFLKGDLLKDDQHEAFFIPEVSSETATLLEHCRRAILKGITEGPHGLPLIGGGDWNDGMNRVGILGKGESVWLAWFLINVMNDFSEVLSRSGHQGSADGFRMQAKRLADIVEANAWDGKWYKRAYFDDGTPLGSHENTEDAIDSLPQSWAVLSGASDPLRAELALKSVEEYLIKLEEGMILLLTPPFDKAPLDPGYIKGYPPGVRENGGQYTHGSLWVPMAFARLENGKKAVDLLKMMHPVAHSLNPAECELYKVEPYVIAADIYSLSGNIGRGGWTWYTGSAGWMYRIWLEEVLGFNLRGKVLKFKPVLPPDWQRVKIDYIFQSSRYTILIENPKQLDKGKIRIELDGVLLEKNEIPLVDDGANHFVSIQFE